MLQNLKYYLSLGTTQERIVVGMNPFEANNTIDLLI